MTEHDEVVERARRALIGEDEPRTDLVKVDQANRKVPAVKPSQIVLTDGDIGLLLRCGITRPQAEAIREYVKHIAARHSIAGAAGIKEATAYARELLDWAKGYAQQAAAVKGSDMTKAYRYIMRYL